MTPPIVYILFPTISHVEYHDEELDAMDSSPCFTFNVWLLFRGLLGGLRSWFIFAYFLSFLIPPRWTTKIEEVSSTPHVNF